MTDDSHDAAVAAKVQGLERTLARLRIAIKLLAQLDSQIQRDRVEGSTLAIVDVLAVDLGVDVRV